MNVSTATGLERFKPMRRQTCVRVSLFAALISAVFFPSSARACPAQIMAAAGPVMASEVAYLAGMIYWWNYYMIDLLDRLPRLANSETMSTQAKNVASTSSTDKHAIEKTRVVTAETRSELAGQFVPSTLTCQLASQQRRFEATGQSFNKNRGLLTAVSTGTALGAPGSGTEKGAVQSIKKTFDGRCNKYWNDAAFKSPAGLTCPTPTDPEMVNRDLLPWTSIFKPINLPAIPASGAWPAYTEAAHDTIKLLIEPSVQDHVKGQALSRPEGQNILLMRMRDLSRLNLARGALEDIVAKRTMDGTTNSRWAHFIEMISGQSVNAAGAVSGELNSVATAGMLKNAQIQSIIARLESQKMMLSEFLRYTEQMLALEAVQLGIKVEETRFGSTTSASTSLRAQ